MTEIVYRELTDRILKAYYNVYNKLGVGFLESVYEKAMLIELKKLDLGVVSQQKIEVFYENENVGNYFADIIVENKVIIELKASSKLIIQHEMQLTNYLKATKIEVGLLLNFGSKPEFKRKYFPNK